MDRVSTTIQPVAPLILSLRLVITLTSKADMAPTQWKAVYPTGP